MDCPRCHHHNADGSRFCGACGSSLVRDVTCSRCGYANPGGQEFCNGCGQRLGDAAAPVARDPRAYAPQHLTAKILQSRSALEGERKQVTVLFADVKGSMDLAEQIDPEEWHRLMDRFFQILTDGVHRFEGTVNQYTGDGIMALFGAPIAHEDHAQRACWAALHLAEELRRYATELRLDRGLGFGVRIGLNSGEVVVGRIGDDLHMDYTAHGHTVGLAQRMEQLAEPGKVFASEHTARLVTGLFALKDLGATRVKGVAEPLRVFELEGAGTLRTRLEVARTRGFSRFVGRGDEMAALDTALERALAGDGQVVGIVAEPGVGKSRLCLEFIERCRARGLPVDQAHCVAHGKRIPFLPLLEWLRGYFGIADRDGDQATREKIAGKLLLLDSRFGEELPLFFDLLGAPDPERSAPPLDPEARQRQIFAALKRLTHARSRREPNVSVVEDLHWIDGGSEAFLENFVEAIAGTRTLVVVNFRPEYQAAWMRKSYYRQLALLPLGPEVSAELLRDLLGDDPSLDGVAHRIHRRTAGNPFFIEEIVQGLVEAGHLAGVRGAYRLVRPVDETALPATAHAVLAARIDRLAEREKAVLQTAAVIGKEFTEPVLRRVVDVPEADLAAALAALTRAELLYETALYPAAEYSFKHPLTQEVAYRSQLGERRTSIHQKVARALLAAHADKLVERAAELAHHYEAAGERLEAARWHRRAAEWVGLSDMTEAIAHWRRVRVLVESEPESAEAIELGVAACAQLLGLGWRLGAAEEEAVATFEAGRSLAERSGNLRSLGALVGNYAAMRGLGVSAAEYVTYARDAMRIAGRTDDDGLKVAARALLAYGHWFRGDVRAGLEGCEAALAHVPHDPSVGADIGGYSPSIGLFHAKALMLMETGPLDHARASNERALELARTHGWREMIVWMLFTSVWICERSGGDAVVALEHGRRALEMAEASGRPFDRAFVRHGLGVAQLLDGRADDAVATLEEGLRIARLARAGVVLEGWFLAVLARAFLARGDVPRARATAEEGIAAARTRETRVYEIHALLALVRALLCSGDPASLAQADATLARVEDRVRETGARTLEAEAHACRAELARRRGDDAVRRHELEEAMRRFTEMGAPARAEQVARELGSSAESSGISSTSGT